MRVSTTAATVTIGITIKRSHSLKHSELLPLLLPATASTSTTATSADSAQSHYTIVHYCSCLLLKLQHSMISSQQIQHAHCRAPPRSYHQAELSSTGQLCSAADMSRTLSVHAMLLEVSDVLSKAAVNSATMWASIRVLRHICSSFLSAH
eukprot:8290-Heterococcus_DN1.PRE.2